jgi:uncharacterized protein (TIGR02118 family)
MSVKVVALIRRRDELTREEFLRYWQIEHPRFVWQLPELRRYVQSPAIEHRATWPHDGMAQLWFPSLGAVARAFASPQADALRAHEEHFIKDLQWFLASETEVPAPSPAIPSN